MLAAAKRLLSNQHLYVLQQKAVGADRLRYKCLDRLALQTGEVVLDIGCGPAYYFERLGDVRYHGFDTSEIYVEHATKRWGHKGEFHCELFTEEHLTVIPPADKILLFGLLHHLSDEYSRQLLDLCSRALAPGGILISVDPCFEPTQGAISRWMSANDRGEFVRTPDEFTVLGREYYGEVDGEVWGDVTRIPSSHWMMRMTAPIRSPARSEQAQAGLASA